MMQTTVSSFADERSRDIAWMQWAELGVSGWRHAVLTESIDLEPLVLFTAWLGTRDNRLWLESLDWCVRNQRLVSASRLSTFLKNADPELSSRFMEYSATLRILAPKANWPIGGVPRQVKLSGESQPPHLDRPPLVQLRMRALFGVSSRSEVLRLLLIDRPQGWSVSELAEQSGYTKVNVASTLDLLDSAGHIRAESTGTAFRYRLAKPQQLREFAGPMPSFQPNWIDRFTAMRIISESFPSRPMNNPLATAADRVRILNQLRAPLIRLGLDDVAPSPDEPDFGVRFDTFAIGLLTYWAGDRGGTDPADTEFDLRHVQLGWEATIREPGRPAGPLVLPDWDELYKEAPRSDNLISDDSTGPLLLAHELMRRAFLRIGRRIEPFHFQPETILFAQDQLRSIPIGTVRSFGEQFLRLWASERIARRTGR